MAPSDRPVRRGAKRKTLFIHARRSGQWCCRVATAWVGRWRPRRRTPVDHAREDPSKLKGPNGRRPPGRASESFRLPRMTQALPQCAKTPVNAGFLWCCCGYMCIGILIGWLLLLGWGIPVPPPCPPVQRGPAASSRRRARPVDRLLPTARKRVAAPAPRTTVPARPSWSPCVGCSPRLWFICPLLSDWCAVALPAAPRSLGQRLLRAAEASWRHTGYVGWSDTGFG